MAFWKKRRNQNDETLEGLIKVRGATQLSNGFTTSPARPPVFKRGRRSWEPRGLIKGMQGGYGDSSSRVFDYYGTNSGDFYRWIRDAIPIISAGVWTWVRLCATRQTRIIDGPAAEVKRARDVLAKLDAKLLELPYGRGSGFSKSVSYTHLRAHET